jgi:CheY-like chemotaxis protein
MTQECISKNVYLADDDEDDRMFFREALKEICKGSHLIMATDGWELMDILHSPPNPLPDIIFLDINMPRKNGLECLEEIKKDAKLKDLPIIIFSTTKQGLSIDKSYSEGANYFISKPNDHGKLKRTLKKVMLIDWKNEPKFISKEEFVLSVA